MLLRGRWIEGVATGEFRERHHQLAPQLWMALCSCLASDLWEEGVKEAGRMADGVADVTCRGLAPV